MRTSTYSQRPVDQHQPVSRDNTLPSISMEVAVDDSGHIIITSGPLGGPFQTIYLDAMQANFMGATLRHMAKHVDPTVVAS